MTFQAVNLLPRPRRETLRSRARLRAWCVVMMAYAFATCGVCVAARLAWGQHSAPLEGKARAIATKVRSSEVELGVARAALRDALARDATVREVLDRPDWGMLLGVIARRLGDELVLRDVGVHDMVTSNAATPTVAGAAPSVTGRTYKLELRGLGRSQAAVTAFVSALEATGLFSQVRLARTGREPFGSVAGGVATSFEIDCVMIDGGRL